jgi:hypothetical protein
MEIYHQLSDTQPQRSFTKEPSMRIPKALSPSAFMLYEKDSDEYCMRHLVTNRPPRTPQPLAASVGSSFDAYVKAELHARIFGAGSDPRFEFDTIFCEQVEPHNRDESKAIGLHAFDNYVHTGTYDELLKLMENAQVAPEFEFDLSETIDGVPLRGKPDCRFVDRYGNHFILDWKCKGLCSKYGASPTKGYAMCRDGLDWGTRNKNGKPSRYNGKEHKNYLATNFNSVTINAGFLETCHKEYATQLTMYGWLQGEEVGNEDVIYCIDEIVGKFMGENERPLLRVANHKARISKQFQLDLHARLKTLWENINDGWIFKDMSREESDAKFEMLERNATGKASDGSTLGDFLSQLGRPAYR